MSRLALRQEASKICIGGDDYARVLRRAVKNSCVWGRLQAVVAYMDCIMSRCC